MDGVGLVGVADVCAQARRGAAVTHGVPVFSDWRELLGAVDVVSVCSPAISHAAIVRAFLNAGTHVLVEKPIATRLAEADQLIALAEAKSRVLTVGHQERFVFARTGLLDYDDAPLSVECWRMGGWTGRGGVSYPRRMLSAAAVAAAVFVAGLGGWGLHAATSSPAASPLSSAAFLTASHQTAGKIYFYNGDHRWLYMSVDIGSGNNMVICQVEGSDGRFTTIGSFRLSGGYGYWGSPDPVTSGSLTGARLVTTTGTVLATATFAA